MLSDIMFL